MLTPQIKKTLDEKWDNCWPVSNLRPVAILDLISFMFFLKKTDDLGLIAKNLPAPQSDHFIATKDVQEFTWTKFKDMGAQVIHQLFCSQNGILDLMKEYGKSNFLYSDFFKAPLIIKPTPKLLLNAIHIDNIFESSDSKTQSEIAEYLLSRAEKVQKEMEFIPAHISHLMISIAEPKESDVILDVSAGYGNVLISATQFVEKHFGRLPFHFSSNLKGMESSISKLRITGMRMILHDIKEPDIKVFKENEIDFSQKPTLFISDVFLADVQQNPLSEETSEQKETADKEIILVESILKNLQADGRAIILVSENFLKSNIPEIQRLRKEIVENNNLEGVIHLFPNNKSSFTAAGILIFNKQLSKTTEEVWFAKMDKTKKTRTINETIINPEDNPIADLNQVNLILDKWKNRKDPNRNNFYINAYDIKANSYNLNYNDYKLLPAAGNRENNSPEMTEENELFIATKKENLHHFFEGAAPLQEAKRKRKLFPAIAAVLVLLLAGGWFYFYYLKNNKISFFHTSAIADSSVISKIPVHNSSLQPEVKAVKNKATKETVASPTKKVIPPQSQAKTLPVAKADSAQGYTVINKAWFHYEPDSTKRKTLFLQPREDLVLIPTAEENGFVYVVYVNKKGQSTHGWIDKKDLEPVE